MMETFIMLGFCFILYETLDFFQSCYTNNNLHERQHPKFSKDQTKSTAATTKQPLPSIAEAEAATSSSSVDANENDENVSSVFNASITTIQLSDTQIDRHCGVENSDLDLIVVQSSNHLNCVDSEFGTGVVEFDDNANANSDNDNDIDDNISDEGSSSSTSDSDLKTIQINQSSSPQRNNTRSSSSRRIYSICDRVNHFNSHSELLIDYQQ